MSIKIIAGPCSLNDKNINELKSIVAINSKNFRPIYGVRVVGLKSRTELKRDASYMGMDFDAHMDVYNEIMNGNFNVINSASYPSVEVAKEILSIDDNMVVATEVVDPVLQMPIFANNIKQNLFLWNPAVNQLGWQMKIIGEYAKKYGFSIGIKNAKNLGVSAKDSEEKNIIAPMEKVWKGLATYTGIQEDKSKIFMIQRGVDEPEKGDFRSLPIHNCAKRVKTDVGYNMLFDPSHSFGPKMRDKIIEGSVEAMCMKLDNGSWLYDGLLIEVGTSTTDTGQHISLNGLSNLIDEISKFREM